MKSASFSSLALAAVLAALSIASCATGPQQGVVPQHPDLTGIWVLNPEASQDPEDHSARDDTGERSGMSRMRAPAESGSFLPSVAFKIVEDDSTLTFLNADGTERVLFQDARKTVQPVEGLGNVTVQTYWKGDKLKVERQLESGPMIIETWELAGNGRQIIISVRIGGVRQSIKFLRVYDAVDR